MNSREQKALLDEVLDLRQKVMLLSDYGQEKSRMLCVIALLTSKLGGKETVGPEDAQFLKDWNDGLIQLEVTQDGVYTVFTVNRVAAVQP